MHHELEAAYFSLRFESHPLEPFVKFMADLAKSDTKYCQLIVKIGFLDLFLNLYLDGFLVSSKAPFVPMPHRSSTLFDRCVEALMTIAADAVSSTSLHAHRHSFVVAETCGGSDNTLFGAPNSGSSRGVGIIGHG
jgi:hypothetical protein